MTRPICDVCGYWAGGGFWVHIPEHPGKIVHTMGCGPVLNGQQQEKTPTLVRIGPGQFGLALPPPQPKVGS